MLGLHEYLNYYQKIDKTKPFRLISFAVGILSYLIISLQATPYVPAVFLVIIPLLFVLLIMTFLFSHGSKPVINAVISIAGIIYVSMPFALMTLIGKPGISTGDYQPWSIMGYFILMWVYDVFAYLTGSLFGKHSLYPSVSPGKSWEGVIGGLVFTLIAAYPVYLLSGEFNLFHWAVIAVIIVTFGTLGDLTESRLKRQANVKDSGHILPGHGGVLDRFDGVLFNAPAVLCYILIFAA
mgnify:FL=1